MQFHPIAVFVIGVFGTVLYFITLQFRGRDVDFFFVRQNRK